MQRQGSRHICCAHLFTQWFVMTSWAAGCVLAGSPAGAGCCLMRLLWGSTLCLARGSHVLCPTSDFLSAVVRGIVPVGDRASPPFRFLCWAPGRVWRAPGRSTGPCFCGCWAWCSLGYPLAPWPAGFSALQPSSPQPCSPVVASFTRPVPAPLPRAQPGWRRPWCLLQACVWPFEAAPDRFSSRGKDTRPLTPRPGGGGCPGASRPPWPPPHTRLELICRL